VTRDERIAALKEKLDAADERTQRIWAKNAFVDVPVYKTPTDLLILNPSNSTLGSCHSVCGVVWVSGMSSVSMGCWQVEQRPVQHLKRGCRSSTALGSVRPAVGDLGAAAPGSESRERR